MKRDTRIEVMLRMGEAEADISLRRDEVETRPGEGWDVRVCKDRDVADGRQGIVVDLWGPRRIYSVVGGGTRSSRVEAHR